MTKKKGKWQVDDEAEYVGNFFGWDVSFIGLGVMLFMIAVIAFRWFSLPPEQRTFQPYPTEEVVDSTTIKIEE